MNLKRSYEVKLIDENTVEFVEKSVEVMSLDEALQKTKQIQQKELQLGQQLTAMTKAMEDNQLEKDIQDYTESVDKMHNLNIDFNKLLKPHFDKLEVEVRQFVKLKKAEIGFSRISDVNLKVVRMAETMSEIANKLELDVAHPVILKVKAEFEKI